MSAFDDLRNEVKNGIEGKNHSIPTGFDRFDKFISIRKRIYTLVFGATGTGKSSFVHDAFILNPFDWWSANKFNTNIKVKIILFSMERSKLYTLAKWTSRKIFKDHGIRIPVGKMLGWWDQKMTLDEHDLFEIYEDYVNELCEFVDIYEGARSPADVYRILKTFAENNGKEEQIDDHRKIYIPNDDNQIVIPIFDHFGLTKLTKDYKTKKEAIDKVSEHFQHFRDFFGMSPVGVSQMTRNLSNPMYQKTESLEPTIDDAKESGRPPEDSDCVVSLFQPHRYKTTDKHYDVSKFIDTETGADYFRSIKILKNTYGEADVSIGAAFLGFAGMFKELPKKKEMEGFKYEDVINGNYFLT